MRFAQVPEWWIIALAIALLVVFVYWDISSRPARMRFLRVFALVIAFVSLLGLYTKPFASVTAKDRRVVLETANADEFILDSLRQLKYEIVSDVFAIEKASIGDLVLVGDGLEEWELGRINQSYTFLPPRTSSEGPNDVRIFDATERSPLDIKLGIKVADELQLTLNGPGIASVSSNIAAEQTQVSMNVVPNLAGHLVYQLIGTRKQDTIFSERIPVIVRSATAPSVLMLSGSPSFEGRYLKNYLTSAGFGIAERQKVSTDAFHEAFTNVGERSLQRLTEQVLKEFRLVVIDAVAYEGLSNSERNVLWKQLRRGEIGMVWLGEGSSITPFKITKESQRKLEFVGKNGKTELNTSGSALSGTSLTFQSHVIGQLSQQGLGAVVIPTLSATYPLMLKGEEGLYARIWQTLLAPVMGTTLEDQNFKVSPFPFINEPTTLSISSPDPSGRSVNETSLAWSERWDLPNEWEATYWPNQVGWHTLYSSDNQAMDQFFVFDSTDWPLRKSREKQLRTKVHQQNSVSKMSEANTSSQPISPWYFFGAFVISIGHLWIDQRLLG